MSKCPFLVIPTNGEYGHCFNPDVFRQYEKTINRILGYAVIDPLRCPCKEIKKELVLPR